MPGSLWIIQSIHQYPSCVSCFKTPTPRPTPYLLLTECQTEIGVINYKCVCVCVCTWSWSLFAAVYRSEHDTHSYINTQTHDFLSHTDTNAPFSRGTKEKWVMKGKKEVAQKNPIDQFIHTKIYKLKISWSAYTLSA